MNRLALAIATLCAALAVGGAWYVVSQRPATDRNVAAGQPSAPPRGVEQPAAARADPPRAAAAGDERLLSAAEPELGSLRIETDVEGALVFIDRQFVGTAPLVAENLTPGPHQFNLTANGFDGLAETIDIEPGPRDLAFRFRAVRLDADLAVVHKHRFGSCHGHLTATPEGLRYEPTEGDDGFNVALGEVALLQVDYQDVNLHLEIRHGRQYDFTDPDGNADRLFVFHREVEKARQQIVQGSDQ